MRNRIGPGLLGAALYGAALTAVPFTAKAGVVKLEPTEFRPAGGPHPVTVSPRFFSSGGASSLNFFAPVRLPVGATVTKLVLRTWGGNPSYNSARLARTRFGDAFVTETGALMFVEASAQQPSLDAPPAVAETASPEYPGTSDLVVRRGYRYYVTVQSLNSLSRVSTVEVHFSP